MTLTLMYVLVPTKVSATLLISSPETPKSQILIWPEELSRILEGLTSEKVQSILNEPMVKQEWDIYLDA